MGGYDVIVYISYGGGNKNLNDALLARNNISKELSKFGKWVGSGCEVGKVPRNYQCDTQVFFRTLTQVNKAKTIIRKMLLKHGVSGRYKVIKR